MNNPIDYNDNILEVRNAAPLGIYAVCGLCALLILFFDLGTPVGTASGVSYIVVILISLKASERRFTIAAAVVCTILVWIGYWRSPPSDISIDVVYINYFLSMLAIWVTTILTLAQRDGIDQLHQERLRRLQSKRTDEIQKRKVKSIESDDAHNTGQHG